MRTGGRGKNGSVATGDATLVEEHQRAAPGHDARQGVEYGGIEHRPRQIGEPADGLVRGHLFLVGARGRERVVDLGGSDDPRGERDRFTAQPIGVAGSVEALVVIPYCRYDVAKVCEGGQNLRSDDHMLLDVLELLRRQRALLVQDRLSRADLSEVVQPAGDPHQLDVFFRHYQLMGDRGGQVGDPRRVPPHVGVLGLEGIDERLERRDRQTLELHPLTLQLGGPGGDFLLEPLVEVAVLEQHLAALERALHSAALVASLTAVSMRIASSGSTSSAAGTRSTPLVPGMRMSHSMSAMRWRLSCCSASSPEPAAYTSNCCCCRNFLRAFRMGSSSSTTRIWTGPAMSATLVLPPPTSTTVT